MYRTEPPHPILSDPVVTDFMRALNRIFPGSYVVHIEDKRKPMAIDLAPGPHAAFAAAFQRHIDEALETRHLESEPRDYLGGSRIGEECARKLAYEFTKTPKDEGKEFKGPTLRIFDMGHDGESRMLEYLRLAGFKFAARPDGQQFGFAIARHPETGVTRIRGHADGIIIGGPEDLGVAYPCLWENKAIGAKSFAEVLKHGLAKARPVYFAQMQLYMMFLEISNGLFTAINRDTGEIYAQMVLYDAVAAKDLYDKGIRVVSVQDPAELPRIAKEATDYRCKFCEYTDRCYNTPEPQGATAVAAPSWLGGMR